MKLKGPTFCSSSFDLLLKDQKTYTLMNNLTQIMFPFLFLSKHYFMYSNIFLNNNSWYICNDITSKINMEENNICVKSVMIQYLQR